VKVALLRGGRSLERQVSLRSAPRVHDALERLGHEVVGLDVGADLVPSLLAARPDVAFVALHGWDGEDGTVQELLEVLGLPYTGPGPSACARAWDKALAKHAMRAAGLPTPDFHAFSQAAIRELGAAQVLPAIADRLRFPLVVKPARQGSALGVRFAAGPEDMPAALVAAFSYDDKVLLERHVAGHDLAVGVLERDGRAEPLPVVEAVPRGGDRYDFEARYEIGRTDFVCPAALPPGVAERAQALAVEAFHAFGCRGVARVDLMLDAAGEDLEILELATVPGLTATSLLPQAAEAAGIGYDGLVAQLLEQALGAAAAAL
jgi:D-alanine-D-alanine ligase